MSVDLDKLNASIQGLQQSVVKLMPDDAVLVLLGTLIPKPVTRENAKTTVVILSLLCHRVANCFTELAVEQEKLLSEWKD